MNAAAILQEVARMGTSPEDDSTGAVADQRQRLHELEDELQKQRDQIDQLQEENQHLRQRLRIVEETAEQSHKRISRVGFKAGCERVEIEGQLRELEESCAYQDQIEELEDQIESEQKTRSHADAKIDRKIGLVAESVDADTNLDDVAEKAMQMDRIERLAKIGPEDVADRVYDVHRRAHVLVRHLILDDTPDWGSRPDDPLGPRIVITSTEAREKIGLARGEGMLSRDQGKRVFNKIEELAEDSPRTITVEKNDQGQLTLVIQLPEDCR